MRVCVSFQLVSWRAHVQRLICLSIGLAMFGAMEPTPAQAQAWVPQPGEGSVWVGYQYFRVKDHLFSVSLDGIDVGTGRPGKNNGTWLGDITANTTFLGVEYGLPRRFAVGMDVAYVSSRYRGPRPESQIDNGGWIGALQDATVRMRYVVLQGPIQLTPGVAVTFPTQSYETLGHAAVGAGLSELLLSLNAGRTLAPFLPEAFVQARYARAIVENFAGLNLDRHEVAVEIGGFITPRVSIRSNGSYSATDGGIDWAADLATPEDRALHFHVHDVGAAEKVWRVGGGVGWAISDLVELSLGISSAVAGENTHSGTGFSIGTSWDIGSVLRRRKGPTP